ncbi:MAG: lysoplasmalogenase [Corallococcus sp.]|nr:lysoplasmalogenase [Corallococcus sp.]
MVFVIVVLCLYGVLLAAYMTLKGFGVKKLLVRGFVKMSLSALFVAMGIYGACVSSWSTLSVLVLVGLVFAGIGDYFLLYKESNKFNCGIVSFGIANVFFIVCSVMRYGWNWISLPILAVLYAATVLGQKVKLFDYGSSVVYLNVYTAFVGYCGSLGITLLFNIQSTSMLLFALGSVLFMLSDIVLGLYLYKIKKWQMESLNSLLYFSAMMLLALGFVF